MVLIRPELPLREELAAALPVGPVPGRVRRPTRPVLSVVRPESDAPSPQPDPDEHVRTLFAELGTLDEWHPRHREIRDELVTLHLGLADHLAHRYGRWGELVEDVSQVARMGLVKAVDRFDPSLGCEFRAFAVPTILGEVRRFFRDTCWRVKIPRRLQELHLRVRSATEQLTQDLGEAPTPGELAAFLDEPVGLVMEALEATMSWNPVSLDEEREGVPTARLADRLGRQDPALDLVDDHQSLVLLLRGLPPRERRILELRFFDEMTQRQIGELIGLSQMHVSRILGTTLERLRLDLLAD